MAGLGASLVDNPVGAGLRHEGEAQPASAELDSDAQEELVLLPDRFGRLASLLSAPEGAPSMLTKTMYAVLVGWPLWAMHTIRLD